MLRWTLPLALIGLECCAGRAPAPPPTERCLTLKDHLRCRAADGTHYSEPYPGKVMRECVPTGDAESRRNWEDLVK